MLLQVLSSLIAAWSDIARFLGAGSADVIVPVYDPSAGRPTGNSTAGYLWMLVNCLVSAGYVLGMRKRIKVTNFKVKANPQPLFQQLKELSVSTTGLGLYVLQQPSIDTCACDILDPLRKLDIRISGAELVRLRLLQACQCSNELNLLTWPKSS